MIVHAEDSRHDTWRVLVTPIDFPHCGPSGFIASSAWLCFFFGLFAPEATNPLLVDGQPPPIC
jgi:hypothetical protein